jgi:hypothetical protein
MTTERDAWRPAPTHDQWGIPLAWWQPYDLRRRDDAFHREGPRDGAPQHVAVGTGGEDLRIVGETARDPRAQRRRRDRHRSSLHHGRRPDRSGGP